MLKWHERRKAANWQARRKDGTMAVVDDSNVRLDISHWVSREFAEKAKPASYDKQQQTEIKGSSLSELAKKMKTQFSQ